MSGRRSVALEVDDLDVRLIVDACTTQAGARRRAAEKASREIVDDAADTGRDMRTGATRVVQLLAAADRLEAIAAYLENGGTPAARPPLAAVPDPPADDDQLDLEVHEIHDAQADVLLCTCGEPWPCPDAPKAADGAPLPPDPRGDPDVAAVKALAARGRSTDGD